MSGKLYALSTGPGASDLITVRASRILGSLDILYAPAGRKGATAWRFLSFVNMSASRPKSAAATFP